MNKSERIAYLKEVIQESPEDPFAFYALCLEEQETLDPARLIVNWNEVLTLFPDYLPSYYQAAKINQEGNRKETAIEILKKGIQLALKHQDQHALTELKSFLQNLLIED